MPGVEAVILDLEPGEAAEQPVDAAGHGAEADALGGGSDVVDVAGSASVDVRAR